jgi:hypothetical protein
MKQFKHFISNTLRSQKAQEIQTSKVKRHGKLRTGVVQAKKRE